MHICSFIYLFIYACAYTSLKINHAWTIHTQNMNPTSNAHAGLNKKSCMHVGRYTSIHTFDFACMRSMLYDVDMWQCASLCITYTHRKTWTHVQSNCMLMHTLRLPVHGQMRAQILLYTYICIAIVVHELIHKLMHKCIREHQFTRWTRTMIHDRRSSITTDIAFREANL